MSVLHKILYRIQFAGCRFFFGFNSGSFRFSSGGFSFGKLRPKNCSEYSYPLYCAAKDLYLGTKHITLNDLADNKLINAKTFALICNAMAIRKYGLGAIQFTDEPKT